MMSKFTWGLPVAIYLFLGGMTSAAYAVGVLAELFSKGKRKNLARVGSYLVLVPIAIGLLLLVVDLGQPFRFWHLMFQLDPLRLIFQTGSVMSVGVWLLILFVGINGILYPAYWLAEEKFGERLPIIRSLKGQEDNRKVIGYIGLPIAFLVSIYTGVLLAATSNTLWGGTPFLPVLFLASAGSAGIAGLIIFLFSIKELKFEVMEDLVAAETVFLSLEYLTILVLLISLLLDNLAVNAIKGMLIGNLAVLFWLGFVAVGLILPYLMNHYHLKLRKEETKLPLAASVLTLFGSLFLRYLVLMAGYIK
jgi:formate-dependent nitrite reductase membrane component NrfD